MIWLIASTLEAGMWLGWIGTKLGSRDKIRSRLINGTNAQLTIPMLDSQLEKGLKDTTKWERKAAGYIATGIRNISKYHALETVIALVIHAKRAGEPKKVRIHL